MALMLGREWYVLLSSSTLCLLQLGNCGMLLCAVWVCLQPLGHVLQNCSPSTTLYGWAAARLLPNTSDQTDVCTAWLLHIFVCSCSALTR